MLSNAISIYNSLTKYKDIMNLIGKQEGIFLDFKETRTKTGKMLDDDKAHFSKAASGFAHQEGGILVWGIEARKVANDVDQAINLKPIINAKAFYSDLNDYIKYATEPIVDGILHKIIFEDDDETKNEGFVVSYFPKSDREHMALGNTSHDFYKRHGDSFTPLSTSDIRALFFRNLAPDLELKVITQDVDGSSALLIFLLKNKGRGIAKFPSIMIGFETDPIKMSFFDGEGNLNYKTGPLVEISSPSDYRKQYIPNSGVVIHPEQELAIARLRMDVSSFPPIKVKYKIFSENMIPKEGVVEVSMDIIFRHITVVYNIL